MIKINVSFVQKPAFVLLILVLTCIIGCLYQTDVYSKLNMLPADRTFEDAIKNVEIRNNKNEIKIEITYSAIFPQTIQNIAKGIILVGKLKNAKNYITFKKMKSTIKDNVIIIQQKLDVTGEIELQVFFYDTPLSDRKMFNISK